MPSEDKPNDIEREKCLEARRDVAANDHGNHGDLDDVDSILATGEAQSGPQSSIGSHKTCHLLSL